MTLRFISLFAATALYAGSACAESPTIMLGLAFDFGANPKENIGITGKVVSTNKPDSFAIGAGGTYFPFAREQVGADISAGYVTDNAAVMAGYDFLRWTPQVSAGWVPTK